MKKVFVFCLCLLLFVGCTGSGSSAKTSAKLPDALEAVSIKDHPFVYRSGDTTYLYASGKSVALYKGEIFGGIYNYLTDGTSLCYIDPNGKLYTVRFDASTGSPAAFEPERISGVRHIARSADGRVLVYETQSVEHEELDALYRCENGEIKYLEESVCDLGTFYLAPDGHAVTFYNYAVEDGDMGEGRTLLSEGAEPLYINGEVLAVAEDLKTVIYTDENRKVFLYREGRGSQELFGSDGAVQAADDTGKCWWGSEDGQLWYADESHRQVLLADAGAPVISKTGAYAFIRDGAFWAQFGYDAPVRLCSQQEEIYAYFEDDGRTLIYATSQDRNAEGANAHLKFYAVTVDGTGVSEPTVLTEDGHWLLPFRGGRILMRIKDWDDRRGELYFGDRLIASDVVFWTGTEVVGDKGSELLFYIENGKLYRFDGETTAVILETAPESIAGTMECFDDGTFLYLDKTTLYYFDGARFFRILENVKEFQLATFPKDTLSERFVDQ